MKKYDIVLINLNPTKGSEQQGIRPCLILQNNAINASKIKTITIVPFTSSIKKIPWSLIINPTSTNNLENLSRLELSQIRTVDQSRIISTLGRLDSHYENELREKIVLFFDLFDKF